MGIVGGEVVVFGASLRVEAVGHTTKEMEYTDPKHPSQRYHDRSHGGSFMSLGFLVGTGMDGAIVEGEDGRAGKSQQNRGMGGDEKLGAPLGGAVNLRQQCQLPLGAP